MDPEVESCEIKVAVIVPVYNEEATVVQTIADVDRTLKSSCMAYQIIVVNDGSSDSTADQLGRLRCEHVKTISHESNLGYGAAIKSGILAADCDVVVIIDADGTYPTDKIQTLVESTRDYDMVVGARIGKSAQIPMIRRPAKWIIKRLAEYLSNTKIPDLNSGFRAMKRDVVMRFLGLLPDGFSLTTTITLAMLNKRYKVHYIPIEYYKRKGASKIRPIRDTLNFVQLIIRTVMYFEPLKIFVPMSLLLFLGGILTLLYRIFAGAGLLVVSILLFLAAIQMLATGMIADLIDKRDILK